jgi:arylsulfatase A-like enzyme
MYAKATFDASGWEPSAENASAGKEQLKNAVANLRQAAAAVTALDDQLPALLNQLKQKRLFDNTLVIFSAVNGSLLGRHGLWGDGAASEPVNMYEEVIRTPMIWAWPGKIPVQHTPPELVSSYDLLPTLCDVVDVPVPERNLSGRSYLALATGRSLPKKEPWKNYLFGKYRDTEVARDARYKLVLRRGGAGPNELFDLRADEREKINQFENPAFVNTRERLGKELAAWKARTAKS